MKKFIERNILEIIIVVLILAIVIATIYMSEQQREFYSKGYQEYVERINVEKNVILADVLPTPEQTTEPTPIPVLTFVPTPTPALAPKSNSDLVTYDIKLSEKLQKYTYETCKKYGIDYELVLAIMYVESSYDPKTVGSSGELSLMQIHPINFEWLQNDLGVLDFYNPEHNILAGIYMLADLQKSFDSTSHVLVAYNVGKYGSKQLFKKGVNETKYSVKVEAVRDELISHGAIINY